MTPRLGIIEVSSSWENKSVPRNIAFELAGDRLTQISVIDRGLNTPPSSPSDGDVYIVGTSPTGVWAGKGKYLAYYRKGWKFFYPVEGARAWVADEDRFYVFDNFSWVIAEVQHLSDLTDVTVTSVTAGQELRLNSSLEWVNEDTLYDIVIQRIPEAYLADQVLLDFVMDRTIAFPINMSGSVFRVQTPSTSGQARFNIWKNGTDIGNINFSTGLTSGSGSMSATTFNSSDRLRITAPSTPKPELTGFVATIRGARL